MSWGKNKTRPETVTVDTNGLEKILADLWAHSDIDDVYRGLYIAIIPSLRASQERGDGSWQVMLSSRQTDVLLSRLPRKTLQGEYGVSS